MWAKLLFIGSAPPMPECCGNASRKLAVYEKFMLVSLSSYCLG